MTTRKLVRYASALVFGFAIVLPLANQSGLINIYEAIVGMWLLLLIPAFLFYRTISKSGSRKLASRLTAVAYILISSLYTLLEPTVAGYNIGYYAFLIPLPASLIIMMPSIFVMYRSKYARPKKEVQTDAKYTDSLKSMLSGIDDSPPEVFIRPSGRRVGSSFLGHTDGPEMRLSISEDAQEIFGEEEIGAALLKTYFEAKDRAAEKFVYKVNVSVMLYVDAIILLPSLANEVSNGFLKLAIALALAVVVLGFIGSFPFIIRRLILKKDMSSDAKASSLLKEPDQLKSFIMKAARNYRMPPLATPRRAERVVSQQEKLARKRVENLERLNNEKQTIG